MKIDIILTGMIDAQEHLLVPDIPEGTRILVPVPCWLIEHNGRRILFDAGQVPPESPQKPDAPFIVRMQNEERAVCKLKKRKVDLSDLHGVVISHNHSDHTGGLRDFPGIKAWVQAAEKDLLPELDVDWLFLDGETDLFGDGSVICIPTPGHTPGHQSLLLRRDDASQILLAADAAYNEAHLEKIRKDFRPDEELSTFERSLRKLLSFRDRGVDVYPGHAPSLCKMAESGVPGASE